MAQLLSATRESHSSLPPHVVEWLRYTIDTLAGVIATDTESFPGWVATVIEPLEQAAKALRSTADSLPRAAPPPATRTEPSSPTVAGLCEAGPSVADLCEAGPGSQTPATAHRGSPSPAVVPIPPDSSRIH